MKERQILFSGAMVCAILDGRKTMTRRIVKPALSDAQWIEETPENGWLVVADGEPTCGTGVWDMRERAVQSPIQCPYGVPGDRLWVREAWRVGKPHNKTRPCDILPALIERGKGATVLYEAGGWRSVGPQGRDEPVYPDDKPMPDWAGKLRPSMFMPRAFSRITLEVTGVRVERLQDISEADAIAEGVEPLDFERYEQDRSICPRCGGTRLHDALGPNGGVLCDVDCRECDTHIKRYRHLWDSLNVARGLGWDANPWVWCVEFRRLADA